MAITNFKQNTRYARVLAVEGNDEHWLLIRSAMASTLPEVITDRVSTSRQALALLASWQHQEWELPKLIMLDLYLPTSEDGWTLLQQIKRMPTPVQQIPLIMLSASDREPDITRSYQLGAAAYVVKPSDPVLWPAYFQQLRHYWWETVNLPPLSVNF